MRMWPRGPVLSANTSVGLTGEGRKHAENYSESGTKFDILIALQANDLTVSDLAKEINESTEETKRWLMRMRGYVRFQDVG